MPQKIHFGASKNNFVPHFGDWKISILEAKIENF